VINKKFILVSYFVLIIFMIYGCCQKQKKPTNNEAEKLLLAIKTNENPENPLDKPDRHKILNMCFKFLKKFPGHPKAEEIHFKILDYYLKTLDGQEHWDKIKGEASRFLSKFKKSRYTAKVKSMLAKAYFFYKDWEKAYHILKDLKDEFPDNPDISYLYAKALYQMGKKEKALAALRTAAKSKNLNTRALALDLIKKIKAGELK